MGVLTSRAGKFNKIEFIKQNIMYVQKEIAPRYTKLAMTFVGTGCTMQRKRFLVMQY